MKFYKNKSLYLILFFFLFSFAPNFIFGQIDNAATVSESSKISFFQPADSLHKGRFWTCASIGGAAYVSVVFGLSQIWYADVEREPFHFFNDWGEWRHVDKIGHALTSYNYTRLAFEGARWTGIKRRNAMWTAAGLSFALQGTIEMLDGYSAKWGFSVPDIGFNTAGIGLFVGQELLWKEQRIIMKVSSTVPTYPTDILTSIDGMHTTTYQERALSLYGKKFPENFIKDYNGQTNWLSFNIHSFMKKKDTRFPKWLNVAVGYGAQNMYEGFNYDWVEEKTGIAYQRDPNLYPRYSQMYLSLDVDLTKIKTKSRFLKTLFSAINFIKIPAPSLEFNTLGNARFIPIYF